MPQSDPPDRGEVLVAADSTIDPWVAREYARILEIKNPLYSDESEARYAGFRDILVPETQQFLATRVGEAGEAPRAAVGLPEGYNSVVTRIRSRYHRHLEAGQPFTVRVRRLPTELAPSKRVRQYHVLEYELTDIDGHVATSLELTIAELA